MKRALVDLAVFFGAAPSSSAASGSRSDAFRFLLFDKVFASFTELTAVDELGWLSLPAVGSSDCKSSSGTASLFLRSSFRAFLTDLFWEAPTPLRCSRAFFSRLLSFLIPSSAMPPVLSYRSPGDEAGWSIIVDCNELLTKLPQPEPRFAMLFSTEWNVRSGSVLSCLSTTACSLFPSLAALCFYIGDLPSSVICPLK